MNFPPLYECSVCGKPVDVRAGDEPVIVRRCEHADAVVWANRKVTLRGVGTLESMNPLRRGGIKLTMTLRQFLSALTGRSI